MDYLSEKGIFQGSSLVCLEICEKLLLFLHSDREGVERLNHVRWHIPADILHSDHEGLECGNHGIGLGFDPAGCAFRGGGFRIRYELAADVYQLAPLGDVPL